MDAQHGRGRGDRGDDEVLAAVAVEVADAGARWPGAAGTQGRERGAEAAAAVPEGRREREAERADRGGVVAAVVVEVDRGDVLEAEARCGDPAADR
nr:hypothetical protein [Conexibacter sp. W3-3-2]